MRDVDLFGQALGLEWPWRVERSEFDAPAKQLDVYLDFERGGTFACPECDTQGCKAYDTTWKRWRHLNFFQHEAFLHAPVPRVECPEHGIKQVRVPWARSGSGFTLLFEALIMALVKQMPVKAVARMVGETDNRLWRILEHYVDKARGKADFSKVQAVGVDETASKRGHNYVSFFVDLDRSQLLFGTEGRDGNALGRFRVDLMAHGGDPGRIRDLCMDMSPAYIAGAKRYFRHAQVTFDRFHVVKLFNEAIEKVRREEQKERPELKRTRWLWLKHQRNLTKSQAEVLAVLLEPSRIALKTAKAYQMKLAFQEFWQLPPSLAKAFLTQWCEWAHQSGLAPMIKLARTLVDHQEGLVRWFHSGLSNGILEGLNSLVQAAKARARGYRTSKNLITMAYLISADLDFGLPI